MEVFALQNDTLLLAFNRQNGALVGLTAVESGWEILNRPELGLSFRMMVPLRGAGDWLATGKRNNPVYGEKQKLASLVVDPDNRRAVFVWEGLTSEYDRKLDIKVMLEVSLTERQAVFMLTIENRSPYQVESVCCPYLGDLQRPPEAAWFKTFTFGYATAQERLLWPTFENTRGYYGFDHPLQSGRSDGAGAPMAPFFLMRSEDQGLYTGIKAVNDELIAWRTELIPGYSSSMDGRVPLVDTVAGKPVATQFAAVHMPYLQPGETRTLTPVALEAFQGGWKRGVDIYKAWRDGWMSRPEVPGWADEPHAWQQIHINSPEDELRFSFKDLVKVGAECARHGVKAIQLTGWTTGGQDQGNPSHDPDPRLGTFEELKDAIAKCQEMGVKVVLFAKFTWADRATARFKDELLKHAIKDPFGDFYHYGGYQYQSAAQMLDINTKRLIPMCLLDEEYLKICDEEFRKILDLGTDGILYDECQHHSPALLCFDESHNHRYGALVFANDRALIRRFSAVSEPINADFLYAGEACYDWEMEVYHLSYFRSWDRNHVPLSRYLLPQAQFMTAVTGFNDRNMINQCLLYRYIISYEPYNFKGHLDDYPLTVEYGKQMDALRTELRAYFWDGEFRHELGASVTVDGEKHHPYAVFINRVTGEPGVVIANYDDAETIFPKLKMEDDSRLMRYRLVDDPGWQAVEDGISIPPCSAAVVLA